MMDDPTLERGLRDGPPADPVYRSRIAATAPTDARSVSVRTRVRQPLSTRAAFATLLTAGVAVLAVGFGGALLVDRSSERGPGNDAIVLPSPTGPAGNGLITYGSGGDIFVGDARTGETRAIVTGPDHDSGPIFSPDGTRVAFLRGDPWGDASIIVVRPDGSNERVAMPFGYARAAGFAWTPDSASLLINHDSEPRQATGYYAGELSLVDASGAGEPRLITPPLPRVPGGPYFTGGVAPMFRPPDGDIILAGGIEDIGHLYAWDASLEQRTEIPLGPLGDGRPYEVVPYMLSWSPDGSRIAFNVTSRVGSSEYGGPGGAYVVNADGSDLRPIPEFSAWSPDGTMLAGVRGCPDPDRPGGAAIAIIDPATGTERILDASIVETKIEGNPPPWPTQSTDECQHGWYAGDDGRVYDHEGWSWSPDGSSILMLERPGAHPLVIDVGTGQATELPWPSDSTPSWQRVATG